jgi:hypothetical protein
MTASGYDRRMGRRTLTALAAVVLMAGCGGGSSSTLTHAQYKARLAAIAKESARAQSGIEKNLSSPTTVAVLGTAMTAFSTAEESISKELDGLTPPQDADAANTELAQGFHDISAAIDDLVPQVRKQTSTQAAIALLTKSQSGTKAGHEVDDALTKLQKLGYTPGS